VTAIETLRRNLMTACFFSEESLVDSLEALVFQQSMNEWITEQATTRNAVAVI